VASWAASAISDDAAAVRAVIEAYGDRLAAADVVGRRQPVHLQRRRHAARARNRRRESAAYGHIRRRFRDMRLDLTFRFDDITVKGDLTAVRATSQGTITIRATGETQPARLRQLFVLERTGANWKITQYMYQQMPEQSGGGCSGI
jgi:hypothetical protein